MSSFPVNPFINKDGEKSKNVLASTSSPVKIRTPGGSTSSSTGVPTAPVKRRETPKQSAIDAMFNDLMSDDDEYVPSTRTSINTTLEGDSPLIRELRENKRKIREKNPTGGINLIRFISVDILLKAPENFFDMYQDDVLSGVNYVRNKLTEGNNSDLIREAQENPTDEEYQNKAYYTVHSLASESVNNTVWRDTHKDIVVALICNEIIGFGVLDPLWRDKRVTEIICNGPKDIQIEISGELYKVPCLKFRNKDHLRELIERLYRSIGKVLSQSTPRVKGRLHDKSRMFAVHDSIAPDGPNFNIRRHPEGFWTPEIMVEKGAASEEMMTFIGNLIYKGASCFIAGSTSSGKALTLDTKILAPDGSWTTMGEVQPGDKVLDRFGNAVTVTNKFDQPEKPVYKVTFDTGESVFCDIEHNWLIATDDSLRKARTRIKDEDKKTVYPARIIQKLENELKKTNDADTITWKEIIALIEVGSYPVRISESFKEYHGKPKPKKLILEALIEHGKQYLGSRQTPDSMLKVKTTGEIIDLFRNNRKVYIPLSNAVEFENETQVEDLPIHPYLFGLWLGDGFSSGPYLAAMPEDAQEYNRIFEGFGLGSDVLTLQKTGDREIKWRINTPKFRRKLHNLGVLQEKYDTKTNKHIPDVYLRSSIESRRLLLAGLLDSDGWSNDHSWGFSNTNTELLSGVRTLLYSLGIRNFLDKKPSKNVKHQDCYSIYISSDERLSLLPRKNNKIKDRINKKQLRSAYRRVIKVEKTDRVEKMACITVDGEDSTYVIENFIVTHNTSMLNALTGFYKPNVRILTLEDNIEMKPNPKKFLAAAMECHEASRDDAMGGGTNMRDLVKAAMQMRPDCIIVGEVTDSAAYDLCQALNTGHSGMSTFHANSSQLSITRVCSLVAQSGLTTIEGATDLVAAAFDFIINVKHFPVDGSRRIVSIDEVGTSPVEINGRLTLPVRQLWRFVDKGFDENNRVQGYWEQVGDISPERKASKLLDLEDDLTWDQLKDLSSIPEELRR